MYLCVITRRCCNRRRPIWDISLIFRIRCGRGGEWGDISIASHKYSRFFSHWHCNQMACPPVTDDWGIADFVSVDDTISGIFLQEHPQHTHDPCVHLMFYIGPGLVWCWASVCDAGPTLKKHRVNIFAGLRAHPMATPVRLPCAPGECLGTESALQMAAV